MKLISNRSEWDTLVDIFEYEFPGCIVHEAEFDFGHGFSMGIELNGKRRAVVLRAPRPPEARDFCCLGDEHMEYAIARILALFHEDFDITHGELT